MGAPIQQHIIIEMAKDNWSWLKWVLGIISTALASVISTILITKFRKKRR